MVHECGAIIIGGGAWGAGIAYYLTKKGLENVVLLDKGDIGHGSTAASGGVVELANYTLPRIMLAKKTVEELPKIQAYIGSKFKFHPHGSIALPLKPELIGKDGDAELANDSRDQIVASSANLNELRIPIEKLNSSELSEKFPYLNVSGADVGFLTKTDGYIENLIGFAETLVKNSPGIRVITNRKAIAMETEVINGKRLFLVNTNHFSTRDQFMAPILIIAAGAWTGELLKEFNIPFPKGRVSYEEWKDVKIKASLGQKVNFLKEPFCVHDPAGFYYRSVSENILHAGLGDRFSEDIDILDEKEQIKFINERFKGVFTDIRDFKILGFSEGAYSWPLDINPVVGNWKYDGLYIAFGCAGNGVGVSLGLGDLLSDIILGKKLTREKEYIKKFCDPNRKFIEPD